jgi:hypothetical protein
MATQQRVKRIRGTTVQNTAATLPEGNFVVKTPIDGTVWVHDGSTPGGFPIGTGAVTFPITVPEGGTDLVTLTAHAVLLGEGTSPVAFATIGTAGWVLTDNGPGVNPTFQAPAAGAFVLDPVTTGTSKTVTLTGVRQTTYWTSATAGAKSTSLPGAAGGNSGYLWIEKTTLSNGDTHTITPSSGTIDGASTFVYTDAKGAFGFISDGVSNWMAVI